MPYLSAPIKSQIVFATWSSVDHYLGSNDLDLIKLSTITYKDEWVDHYVARASICDVSHLATMNIDYTLVTVSRVLALEDPHILLICCKVSVILQDNNSILVLTIDGPSVIAPTPHEYRSTCYKLVKCFGQCLFRVLWHAGQAYYSHGFSIILALDHQPTMPCDSMHAHILLCCLEIYLLQAS